MTDNPIPEDLRSFILEHFDSVAQLEALLLLRRHPAQDWDATGAARLLYVPAAEAGLVLAQLHVDGFLSFDEKSYRYSPATPELANRVDRLAEAYSRALIPVTNLVHGNPRRLRRFADAFRFRKDK